MIRKILLVSVAMFVLLAFSAGETFARYVRTNDYARANRPKVRKVAQEKIDAAIERIMPQVPKGYEFEKTKYNFITDIEPSLNLENFLIVVPFDKLPWANYDEFVEAAKEKPRCVAMMYTDFPVGDHQGYFVFDDPGEDPNVFLIYYGISTTGRETVAFVGPDGEPVYTDLDNTKFYKIEVELKKGEDKEFPRVRFNLPSTIFKANMRLPLRFEDERVSFLKMTRDDPDNLDLDGFFRIRTSNDLFTDNVL
jgi:hypothetical protein